MASINQTESITTERQELLVDLDRNLPPVRWSFFYRLSVWISAAALLLVTCLYASLVAIGAWFAFDYFVSHLRLLATDAEVMSVFFYSIPPLIFLAVWALLIKPLFRWESPAPEPVAVNREEEPLLYEFVDRICRSVGTETVDRIQFVLGAQAAVYREGRFGGILSHKRVLVLGLPIIAGCNVAELAGIVAHEMGHFAKQRNSVLISLIRTINGWFQKAIFEPDRFDLWLARQTSPGQLTRWLFLPLRSVLTLGRTILWVFFILVEAASSMISRKEEYDCDQFMARLVGSERACDALRRVHVLGVAAEATLGDIEQSWNEKRLPDDITKMVLARAERFDMRQQEIWMKVLSRVENNWFDTHPSLADRLRALKRLNFSEGRASKETATLLMRNFEGLSQSLSIEFYKEVLDQEFAKESLVASEVLQQEYVADADAQSTLHRYFQVEPLLVRPIFPDFSGLSETIRFEEMAADLAVARQQWLDEKEKVQKANDRFLTVRTELLDLRIHERLAEVGLVEHGDVAKRTKSLAIVQKNAVKEVDEISIVAQRRMTYALQLLKISSGWPEDRPRHLDDRLRKVDRVLSICQPLMNLVHLLDELLIKSLSLNVVIQNFDEKSLPRNLRRGIRPLANSIRTDLQAVGELLSGINYPFEHRDGVVSMEHFLTPKIPEASERSELVFAVGDLLQRTDMLVSRTLAAIAEACEQVEIALGHARQEDPPELDPWEQLDKELDESQRPASSLLTAGSHLAAGIVLGLAVAMLFGVYKGGSTAATAIPHHPKYQPTVVPRQWMSQQDTMVPDWSHQSVTPATPPLAPMPMSPVPRHPQLPGSGRFDPRIDSVGGTGRGDRSQPPRFSPPVAPAIPRAGLPNSQNSGTGGFGPRQPGMSGPPANRPTPTSPSQIPRPGFP